MQSICYETITKKKTYIYIYKSCLFVDFVEVFLGCFWAWLDGFITWVPVSWTNFTVFFSELESLQQSQGFFNRSTDWQVIDGDLSQDTLWINQENTSQGNTFFFN